MTTIRKIVGIHPNEGKETFLFFLYFFCLIASIIIGKTARDVFFLSRFNPSFLPHIFIISAACVMVTTIFFIRSARNKDIFLFAKITLSLFALSLLLINTFLNKWTYPLLYVWIDIIGAILVPQFWLLANTQFTTRQAKRLFGPISAASAFANIFIGFSIQYGIIVPKFLLPVASIFLFLSLLIIYAIKNNTPANGIGQTLDSKEKRNTDVSIFTSIRHHKYIGLLCVIVAVASITITLIEYQFKIIASNTYDENQLASLFGMLYGIVGLVSGFMQVFVISRILKKFGVLIGLLILPVFLGITSMFLTLNPVIIFALMARLSDLILRFSFHDITMQILWLPVSGKLKQSAKPFIDGTVKNTAQGLAGLLILGVIGFIGSQFINILIIVLIIVWIICSVLLKNGYLHQLKEAVGKRELNLETLRINITDPYLVDLFKKTLISGNDEQKLFVLNEIQKLSPGSWGNELTEIFHNGTNNIRNQILKIAHSDNQILPDSVITDLVNSPDDPLRSKGIIIATKRRLTHIIPSLENLLINVNPDLQASANTALIILGEDGVENARAKLYKMLNETNIKSQIAALKAASNFSELLTHEQLKTTIKSDYSELQILATEIISNRKIVDLLPFIIANLDKADIYRTAILALHNFNSEKVESIIMEKLVEKRNSIDTSTLGLIKASGEFGSAKSIEFLIHLIDDAKQDILVDAILQSCKKITAKTNVSQIHSEQLEKLLQNRFKYAYEKLHYIHLIQSLESCDLLHDHFQVKFNEEIKRILIILGILYPDNMTQTYIHKLQSTDRSVVSNVLEIIESQYPDKIEQVLMPLIDETSIKEKLNAGSAFLGSNIQSANDIIIDLSESEEPWESALAIHTIINNHLESLIFQIDWQRSLNNPFIQELISKELNLKDSTIKNTIQPFIKTSDITEDISMFTSLDKTIILKGVNLFSGLSGEEVFQIAQIAIEERYLAEEVIFREGDVGDSMFIIIDGSVSVYNQKKVITTLIKGECFGEMALLDREPRSSSIRTVTDTAVLKIDEESFYELVAGNIEIIQGIVKILSKRLRQSIS